MLLCCNDVDYRVALQEHKLTDRRDKEASQDNNESDTIPDNDVDARQRRGHKTRQRQGRKTATSTIAILSLPFRTFANVAPNAANFFDYIEKMVLFAERIRDIWTIYMHDVDKEKLYKGQIQTDREANNRKDMNKEQLLHIKKQWR